jgi:hypothetical protein
MATGRSPTGLRDAAAGCAAKRRLDDAAKITPHPAGIPCLGPGIYYRGNLGGLQMRLLKKVIAALVLATAALQVSGNESVAATNCGFISIEQCRASAAGLGASCVPNQFYNPKRSAKDTRKRQDVRAYAMPYDPYRWCAEIPDNGS